MQEIEFEKGERKSKWWGYGDYYCISPNGTKILLPYKSEPPHGDSYHNLIINSKTIKGYVWSTYLLWSECGRYFTCDWLEGMGGHRDGEAWFFTQTLRATIVVSPEELLLKCKEHGFCGETQYAIMSSRQIQALVHGKQLLGTVALSELQSFV